VANNGNNGNENNENKWRISVKNESRSHRGNMAKSNEQKWRQNNGEIMSKENNGENNIS
jgi:hypothetical protein